MTKISVVVLIGNSDDKLSQKDWNYFVANVKDIIWIFEKETHFIGSSDPFSEYQSGCFVFVIEENQLNALKERLLITRQRYKQDFVALIVGNTEFI